ncbi:MAG: site-specific integrase, partial [Lachnospiraceae bacterium]
TGNAMMKVLGRDTLVNKLSAQYIRDRMLSIEADSGTINELLKRSKSILRWGYNNEYMNDISYLDKIQPLPDSTYREKVEDKYLEADDFKLLLNGMNVLLWELVSKFLGLSGLRIGEAIALENVDIDFKNRLIHISKTFDVNNLVETSTKTLTSHREIYMQEELYEVCRDIKACMLRQGLTNGYGKSRLFLQGPTGDHIKYYAYNKYVKENGLRTLNRENITPHIFRHTHTCMLAENGVQLDTISRRLGHGDSKITKDVYSHVTKRIKQNDYDQVAKVRIM